MRQKRQPADRQYWQQACQVMDRAQQLAQISESEGMLTRTYLSKSHLQANKLVGHWMEQAGMSVWQDAVGNICGRYEGQQLEAEAILLGSHLDTVRNAGSYDGMLGVLVAIEVVASLHRQQQRLNNAIEIIGFADEEGVRFGVTLIGSRAVSGSFPSQWLDITDNQGISMATALAQAGFDPSAIPQARRSVEHFCAYLELHIEQGPCLEQAGLALGVVQAINGARRLHCHFTGKAGHAGTVPMTARQDALSAAAEWIVFIEQQTQLSGNDLVATVGQIEVQPGAVNVIAGEVSLSLDVRGPEDLPLDQLLARLLNQAQQIADKRKLQFDYHNYYHMPATRCDPALQGMMEWAVEQVQGQSLRLPSGAGHDAIAMAEKWPVAMLFVRCEGGLSHHPQENVLTSDVALALAAFQLAVWQVAQGIATSVPPLEMAQ